MRSFLILLTFIFVFISIYTYAFSPDAILGKWLTADGDAVIELYKCDGKYCGKIIWAKNPTKKDIHNPDPSLRNRTLVGTTILKEFIFNGDNKWTGGRIYNPDNGKSYKCKLSMDSKDKLKVRGYILYSLFGKTTVWRRVKSIPKEK